ncbi:unnamed protein product [Albugo candida]|uniref:Vacuolar membrane-associated protein iml1 n=1 Tax=Albugo candida TaxID=65357 RepID=A0A024GC48_9STRA|nr:unnamed protein product [Albugo candida]|eukprot:CCI44125.1 unnamed protein product [Albugo candida]
MSRRWDRKKRTRTKLTAQGADGSDSRNPGKTDDCSSNAFQPVPKIDRQGHSSQSDALPTYTKPVLHEDKQTSCGSYKYSNAQITAGVFNLHVHGHEFHSGQEIILSPEHFSILKEIPWNEYVIEVFHPSDEYVRSNSEDDLPCGTSTNCIGSSHSTNQNSTTNSIMNSGGTKARTDSSRRKNAFPYPSLHNQAEKDPRNHLLLEIPHNTHTLTLKGKVQVSILKEIATFFNLQPFKDVVIRFVPKNQVEAEFVEISLKDQFISRRDLWYLKRSVTGKPVSVGKNVRVHGTRWQVMDVHASKNEEQVVSGVISEHTKLSLRSKTSRVMWLIQISPELWDLANSGYMYLEILVNVVHHVLQKWIRHKVSHSLTILFFARSYYPEDETEGNESSAENAFQKSSRSLFKNENVALKKKEIQRANSQDVHHNPEIRCTTTASDRPAVASLPICVDEENRKYQDFYKVVVFDSTITDVQPLLVRLKCELNDYPRVCGWRSPKFWKNQSATTLNPQSQQNARDGVPSNAQDGNLLEAINIVLNIFDKHHIDRHLARTGQNVVIATAGNGIFKVNKQLSEITEQRMMDHGIGIDIICLSSPPLHRCPLFIFKQPVAATDPFPTTKETQDDSNITSSSQMHNNYCSCAGNQAIIKSVSQVRRSRTGSMDTLHDVHPTVTSMSFPRNQQLCKHCCRRLEKPASHVVPLWIPVTFVQDILQSHPCRLDDDLSENCDICSPMQDRCFEPLPLCRMMKKKEMIRNLKSSQLPHSLEYLLDLHHSSEDHPDFEFKSVYNSIEKIAYSDNSLHKSNQDVRFDGISAIWQVKEAQEDFLRARAPSIDLNDDDISALASLMSPNNYAPPDNTSLLQRFQRYDDQIFQHCEGKEGYFFLQTPKTPDNDRLLISPPQRPNSGAKSHGTTAVNVPHLTLGMRASTHSVADTQRRRVHHGSYCGSPGHSVAASAGSSIYENYCTEGGDQYHSHHPGNESILNEGPSPHPYSESILALSISPAALGKGALKYRNDDTNGRQSAFGSLPNAELLDHSIGLGGVYGSSYGNSYKIDGVTSDSLFRSHADLYKQLTSNHRRWSQLYNKRDPFKLVRTTFQWKSLVFPALLPLTTDYFPSPKELKAHYTESFYSITLPERDEQSGETYQDYRELVMEMIAQRFSQDFQLVTKEGISPFQNIVDGAAANEKQDSVFRLSMGHRIHEITYNQEAQTIDVKRYQQRAVALSDVDIMEYRYSLWSPVCEKFLAATQEFRKYSRSEYSWNYLDQLICGYYDEMSEVIKYKRITYCILPPPFGAEYTERFSKFHDYLKSRAGNSSTFPPIQTRVEWRAGMSTSGKNAFERVRQQVVKIPLHSNDTMTRQNWILLKLDTELSSTQCYHIELQWMVCCSSMVEDFILGLSRRAKQLSLDFLQVPAYGISPNLNMHPILCPIFIAMQDQQQQRVFESALVEHLNFCPQGLQLTPSNQFGRSEEYRIIHIEYVGWTRKRRGSYYRQYIHRVLPCYIRITQTGVIWISSCQQKLEDFQQLYAQTVQTIDSIVVASTSLEFILQAALDSSQ